MNNPYPATLYKIGFPPPLKNHPENLDPSYKTGSDFRERPAREIPRQRGFKFYISTVWPSFQRGPNHDLLLIAPNSSC